MLALAALVWAKEPVAREIFIAPDGDDARGDGSLQRPYGSLEKARDSANLLKENHAGPVHVTLRGGTYRLKETFTLGAADSGTEGGWVRYRSAAGETAILSGSIPLSNWAVRDGIWKTAVPSGWVRQFYVNGQKRKPARSPGLERSEGLAMGEKGKARGLLLKDTPLPVTNDLSGLEVVFPNEDWRGYILPGKLLENTQSGLSVLAMKEPYLDRALNLSPLSSALNVLTPFFLQNHPSLLVEPGTWVHLPQSQEVWYRPLPGERPESVLAEVPVLERLVAIEAESMAQKVHHVSFDGLVFQHTTWEGPSKKAYMIIQAQWLMEPAGQPYQMAPAAVRVHGAEHLEFLNCRFFNLGAAGLSLVHGVRGVRVEGNLFSEIAEGGLTIGTIEQKKIDSPSKETCKELDIRNNLFYRIGTEYSGAPAIQGYTGEDIRIAHNAVHTTPYSGICFGWWWTTNIDHCRNIQIVGNRLENVMGTARDGGAIYTISPMPGSRVAGNHIRAMWEDYGAIYHDECSSQILTEDNVMDQVPMAVYLHKTLDLTLRRNYSSDSNIVARHSKGPSSIEPIISADLGNWPSEAKAIMAAAGLEINFRHLLSVIPTPTGVKGTPPVISGPAVVKAGEPIPFTVAVPAGQTPYGRFAVDWAIVEGPEGAKAMDPKGVRIIRGAYLFRGLAEGEVRMVSLVPGTYRLQAKIRDGVSSITVEKTMEVAPGFPKGENLALGKPVTVSSTYQNASTMKAETMVDGNPQSYWASSALPTGDWAMVDLGGECRISSVEIQFRSQFDFAAERTFLEVQGSTDPSFTEHERLGYIGRDLMPQGATWLVPVKGTGALRYVRVVQVKRGQVMSLAEIRVYGTP